MKNLLSRTKSGRRKGSLGLVLDSDERDAAEEVASTNGLATAPAPADAVDDANHVIDAWGAEPADGDGDESPTTPLFRPALAGRPRDQTEWSPGLEGRAFTVKTALVEMRTRSSLSATATRTTCARRCDNTILRTRAAAGPSTRPRRDAVAPSVSSEATTARGEQAGRRNPRSAPV